MKKYDTERFLKFNLKCNPDATSWDAHYVDLAFVLSALNRRFYRQGKVYHINNIYVHDSQGDVEARFLTAPNTWVTRSAWSLGFKNWKKQRAQTMQGMSLGATAGKWSDFKVLLDGNHIIQSDAQHTFSPSTNPDDGIQAGFTDQLTMQGGDGNSPSSLYLGEWYYSKFYEPEHIDGAGVDEQLIHLMGPHYKKDGSGNPIPNTASTGAGLDLASVGLISAMEEIYPRPPVDGNPALPTDVEDSVYARLFSVEASSEEIMDDLEDENDMPPYHGIYLPGGRNSLQGPIQKRAAHIATTFGPTATVGGFSVPCGLLRIETQTATSNTVGIVIELTAGSYKGILAEDM